MGRWSKQGCIKSASEYNDLKRWIRERKTSYLAARDNGWLDDCCAHMGIDIPNTKWTLDRCQASSKDYLSKVAWLRADREAYSAAVRNNWLEKCCAHMKYNNAAPWVFEDCAWSALACTSRFEWETKDQAAYSAAKQHGWYDDCCRHMPGTNELTQRMSSEECILFAKKYDTQLDFVSNDSAAYAAAKRNSWMPECTAHMTPHREVRTLESCKEAANKFKSPSSWYYNDPCTYIYACRHGWVENCYVHMNNYMESITRNMCFESAANFENFQDFCRGDHIHFKVAEKAGWLPEIKELFMEKKTKDWLLKKFGELDR